MTATDELIAMLKERGVEWGWTHRLGIKVLWTDVNGTTASAINWGDRLLVSALLTPEQVIDVTLGKETCKDADVGSYFVCSECEALVKLHSIGRSYVDEFGKRWYATSNEHGFNYCPNCGRRIEADE